MWHIYKYELPNLGETCDIETPLKLNICDINHQKDANGHDRIFMWACVDISSQMIKRTISVIGTGWEIDNPDKAQFLRTVHLPSGYVCHVLALHTPEPNEEMREITLNEDNSASIPSLNDENSSE
jgi:hypothetical protein